MKSLLQLSIWAVLTNVAVGTGGRDSRRRREKHVPTVPPPRLDNLSDELDLQAEFDLLNTGIASQRRLDWGWPKSRMNIPVAATRAMPASGSAWDYQVRECDPSETQLEDPKLEPYGASLCFNIRLPQNYLEPYDATNSQPVVLKVIRVYHPSPATETIIRRQHSNNREPILKEKASMTPLVYPIGGPGMSFRTLSQLSRISSQIDGFLWSWDYRGIGYSKPLLNCPNSKWTQACNEDLIKDKIFVKNFATIQNVLDMEAIRQHVIIPNMTNVSGTVTKQNQKIKIFGHSYGSAMALAYTELFGEFVQATVAEGIWWPGFAPHFVSSTRLLEVMGRRVANHVRNVANAEFPGAQENFAQFITQLNTLDPDRRKLVVNIWRALSRPSGCLQAPESKPSSSLHQFQSVMTSRLTMSQFRAAFDNWRKGSGGTGNSFCSAWEDFDGFAGDNLHKVYYYANQCFDAGPLLSVERLRHWTPLEGLSNINPDTCIEMGAFQAANGRTPAMASDDQQRTRVATYPSNPKNVPILVINGTYDFVTPPSFAKKVHETLNQGSPSPRAKLFFMEHRGHGATSLNPDVGAADKVIKFLNDGTWDYGVTLVPINYVAIPDSVLGSPAAASSSTRRR